MEAYHCTEWSARARQNCPRMAMSSTWHANIVKMTHDLIVFSSSQDFVSQLLQVDRYMVKVGDDLRQATRETHWFNALGPRLKKGHVMSCRMMLGTPDANKENKQPTFDVRWLKQSKWVPYPQPYWWSGAEQLTADSLQDQLVLQMLHLMELVWQDLGLGGQLTVMGPRSHRTLRKPGAGPGTDSIGFRFHDVQLDSATTGAAAKRREWNAALRSIQMPGNSTAPDILLIHEILRNRFIVFKTLDMAHVFFQHYSLFILFLATFVSLLATKECLPWHQMQDTSSLYLVPCLCQEL